MPFFRFHAIQENKLAPLGERLISGVVDILNCPRETVVLEIVPSLFVSGIDGIQAYPFVEVLYFQRPRVQQDRVARFIYECLREAGYPESDIYFSYLQPENYYENGKIIE